MRRKKIRRPKVGLEIEVNDAYGLAPDNKIWSTKHEHCGTELVSKPAEGASEIRKLTKSIRSMSKQNTGPGFENAGTHIHIDFCGDSNADPKDLVRLTAKKIGNIYDNPLGNGKRFFWVNETGEIFSRPSDYVMKSSPSRGMSPNQVYSSESHDVILERVKRFFAIGVRFSDVLFGLQKPERRFNKYCHTIGDWDENILNSCSTISNIANHPNLGQNHRRLMINPQSFYKFGTIEVRMIKASLNWREIFSQIVLFTRMANLAKSNDRLPNLGTTISTSLINLLDACEIHGKQRRTLCQMFDKNMASNRFEVICFNYNCQRRADSAYYYDFGLSRGVCSDCNDRYWYCAGCGACESWDINPRDSLNTNRHLCIGCAAFQNGIRSKETDTMKYHMGTLIGEGLDSLGNPTRLRKLREQFKLL